MLFADVAINGTMLLNDFVTAIMVVLLMAVLLRFVPWR